MVVLIRRVTPSSCSVGYSMMVFIGRVASSDCSVDYLLCSLGEWYPLLTVLIMYGSVDYLHHPLVAVLLIHGSIDKESGTLFLEC